MAQSEHDRMGKGDLVKKLEAVGWGLFFVWLGIAFLANVGWTVGLLGVGLIALGGQAARKYFGLAVEPFGLLIGIVFVVWGVWESLAIRLGQSPIPGGLLPILLIVLGVVLVVSGLRPRRA